AQAEAITRALLLDFAHELEQENLTRPEADRLVIDLAGSSFAQPATAPWPLAALQGAGVGAALGILLVLLRGWQRRGLVLSPLEAEQLVGAPTLAAIPKT
nr:hypothetical protein [Ardenticatenales bacterium]